MKAAAQELARLGAEIPSFAFYHRVARASYLVLRGRHADAIELLEADREPRQVIGWSRSRGVLARAYNELGQHAQARAVAERALAALTPGDLAYTAQYLDPQIELARALAGLGELPEAKRELDALISQHSAAKGPLTLGALHEARCEVALRECDLTAAHTHLEQADRWFRSTGVPSLIAASDALARRVAAVAQPHAQHSQAPRQLLSDEEALLERVRLQLAHASGKTPNERADVALRLALELSGADCGFLLRDTDEAEPAAQRGGALSSAVLAWASQNLQAAAVDEQTELIEKVTEQADTHQFAVGRTHYNGAPLLARTRGAERVIGILVLGFDNRACTALAGPALWALAQYLASAVELRKTAADD
ncbi:MAG: hypothetical protein JWN04_6510, partial [Myxococcaceae bacterium]|nr:hypothetical protein [Myxococcaceae bacterium]